MPATRRASRRRRQRAVRVVSLRSAASPLPEDALNGWHTGIGGLQLLGRHFPDFFREHAAARAVEPAQLLGCCAAFFQLVKQAGLPLRDIGDSYAYDELEFADTRNGRHYVRRSRYSALRAFDPAFSGWQLPAVHDALQEALDTGRYTDLSETEWAVGLSASAADLEPA